MNRLHDLLLAKPLSDKALEILLFSTFALHILFVLLMLGTAMIAVFYFIHSWLTGYQYELRWDKRVLQVHLALKSLAVVLGVAPILLIQVLWSVPFLTAATIVAPYWLALTGLMIVAFLSLDILGHKIDVHPLRHLFFGILGLTALLAVPAVFTGVLSLMEHPGLWASVARQGFSADGNLIFHWLMRYLHILGAAALFGGAFHYFFSIKASQERYFHLSHWMITAILFQVVVGVLLLTSVTERLNPSVIASLAVGVLAAMLLVGIAFYRNPSPGPSRITSGLVLLPVILVSMLLARQFLQHQAVAPLQAELEAHTQTEKLQLAVYQGPAQQQYFSQLETVYDDGRTIYLNSCSFCHGKAGDGNGPESASLIVPPEKLAAVRAERSYLYTALTKGINGSGMPYFTIFDRNKLESLLDYLDESFTITARASAPGKQGDRAAAGRVFQETCSICHGTRGQISAFGRDLKPPPPDFTRFSLDPERTFDVITNGYTGTVMQPFRQLPEAVRRGLVAQVIDLRKGSE